MALSLGNSNFTGNPEFVRKTAWIVLWCLLPYYALAIGDGFFLLQLVRDPLLFVTYDFTKFVLIPCAVLLYLFHRFRLGPATYIFAGRRTDYRWWEVVGIAIWWTFVLNITYILGEPLVMYPIAAVIEPLHWILSHWLALPELSWRYEARFSYNMAQPDNVVLHALSAIFFSITAGIVEEIFFRGLLRQVVSALLGPKAVKTYIVGSAVIFGLAHWEQGSTGLYNATAFGLAAAFLYLKLGDLRPLILAHTLIDLHIFW